MPATLRKTKQRGPLSSRAKVTSKGQITIPSALRKRMGIVAGDSLLFKTRGKEVLVVPQRRESVFEEFRGIGTKGIASGRQAVLDWVREFRGEL